MYGVFKEVEGHEKFPKRYNTLWYLFSHNHFWSWKIRIESQFRKAIIKDMFPNLTDWTNNRSINYRTHRTLSMTSQPCQESAAPCTYDQQLPTTTNISVSHPIYLILIVTNKGHSSFGLILAESVSITYVVRCLEPLHPGESSGPPCCGGPCGYQDTFYFKPTTVTLW